MEQQPALIKKRIDSIDILRGLVMVIMALDHVRDYFHISASLDDPLNLQTTTPILYFTRWITHFCAPVFVFLSGTSIYLQSLRKSKSELSAFLIKRGLWLILVEVLIITFAWSFNPHFNIHFLQVIWAIGISMVVLGLLIWLPFSVILGLGLLIVFGHNLLDIPESRPGFKPGFFWDLFHSARFSYHPINPGHGVLIVYPFFAWIGIMALGYCTGIFFGPVSDPVKRKKFLIYSGSGLILLFVALRLLNGYGDPEPWSVQRNGLYTLFSFLKVTKYPPSLLFFCITIGPSLCLLALIENIQNRFTEFLRVFGRVAFFYYVIHLYLIHLLAVFFYFTRGHSLSNAGNTGALPFYFVVPGEGFGLVGVYLVWVAVVIILFPLCKAYDRYKTAHKEKWWLSYL